MTPNTQQVPRDEVWASMTRVPLLHCRDEVTGHVPQNRSACSATRFVPLFPVGSHWYPGWSTAFCDCPSASGSVNWLLTALLQGICRLFERKEIVNSSSNPTPWESHHPYHKRLPSGDSLRSCFRVGISQRDHSSDLWTKPLPEAEQKIERVRCYNVPTDLWSSMRVFPGPISHFQMSLHFFITSSLKNTSCFPYHHEELWSPFGKSWACSFLCHTQAEPPGAKGTVPQAYYMGLVTLREREAGLRRWAGLTGQRPLGRERRPAFSSLNKCYAFCWSPEHLLT